MGYSDRVVLPPADLRAVVEGTTAFILWRDPEPQLGCGWALRLWQADKRHTDWLHIELRTSFTLLDLTPGYYVAEVVAGLPANYEERWYGNDGPFSDIVSVAFVVGTEDADIGNRTALLDQHGRPASGGAADSLLAVVRATSQEFLDALGRRPDLIHQVSPREFEEVVATLLAKHGFRVELTARSRDDGRDIHVARSGAVGSFLYLVECKNYAPNRPVGVKVVREVYGVVEAERATAGLIVSTSSFTRGATRFVAEKAPYRMALREFFELERWLRHPQL